MKTTPKYPLVKLPPGTQYTLFLIREELKIRKFFRTLEHASLYDCWYQPHLDQLILQRLGLDENSDETFLRYTTIMDKRARKIKRDPQTLMKQALKAWHELAQEKTKTTRHH